MKSGWNAVEKVVITGLHTEAYTCYQGNSAASDPRELPGPDGSDPQ